MATVNSSYILPISSKEPTGIPPPASIEVQMNNNDA